MNLIKDFLTISFGGNTVFWYMFAVVSFALTYMILRFFSKYVIKKFKKNKFVEGIGFAKLIVNFMDSLPKFFFVTLSLIPVFLVLNIPKEISIVIVRIFIVISSFFLIKFLYIICYYFIIEVYLGQKTEEKVKENTKNMLEIILKVVIWMVGILFILSNIGVEITPLIASLGIGGIAVGFALQSILSDVFASFSIFFDKPFEIGDYIKVGKEDGTVTDISFKSTKIQTLDGQMLIIPNKDIANARVNNFAQIAKRRAKLEIGVIYETSSEKLKKIPDLIRRCIENQERISTSRVVLKSYGDFSINFEAVYYVHTSDYKEYLEIKQKIHFEIFDIFEKEGIQFAYPTQVVKLEK